VKKDFDNAATIALIEDYLKGDLSAFNRLYDSYRLPLFNYIRRQLNSQHETEDIYQDIWMSALKSLKDFRRDSNFTTWLFAIAHNRLVDYWRKHQKLENGIELDALSAQSHSLEYQQFLSDCVELLSQLIATLKPSQKNTFLLQQESRLSLEEIATVTGTNRETVKSRLRYALQKLRSGLKDCMTSGDDHG